MKKRIIIILAVTLVTAFFIPKNKSITNEIRGIYISYIEYMELFDNKDGIELKKEIDKIIENINNYYFNTIYLQVRPFSDSIYFSNIFPFSKAITGIEGKKTSFDVLEYFIEKANEYNMKIHAWINPYRISNSTNTMDISVNNPAYKWLNTNHVKVIENKGIYYNPASAEVRSLIISGIEEIVSSYAVDGILFDDYFYPDDTIDLDNYEEYKNTISINDYRLNNINLLIKEVYKSIKNINPDILFGVSPDGNINNNYEKNYADVKTWLREKDYIDYIMPQLYYGFFNENKPYIKTLYEWNELIKNDVDFVVALALYKAGEKDVYAKSGNLEWINSNDIIKKQIQVSRNMSNYNGYCLFRYGYLINKGGNMLLQKELNNYLTLY